MDFMTYLATFDDFDALFSAHEKTKPGCVKEYRGYLDALLGYLAGFHAQLRCLADPEAVLRAIEEDFAEKWAARKVPGWFAGAVPERPPKNTPGREEAEKERERERERQRALQLQQQAQAQGQDEKQQQQDASSLFCKACDKEFAKNTYVSESSSV